MERAVDKADAIMRRFQGLYNIGSHLPFTKSQQRCPIKFQVTGLNTDQLQQHALPEK